jgi:hypothetical protein
MRTPAFALAARLLAVILSASAAASCAIFPAIPVSNGAVVVVTSRGGDCPDVVAIPARPPGAPLRDGVRGACDWVTVIERDGRVHVTQPVAREIGRAPDGTLAALEATIQRTNFDRIRSRPFTGECPTAFDGQELIYEFSTPSGMQRIASCEAAIDPGEPLFVALDEALAIDT